MPSCEAAADAIRSMLVRGAPLIGATAAYGMALAMRDDASDAALDRAYAALIATRPTAINLKWALRRDARAAAAAAAVGSRGRRPMPRAAEIAEEDIAINRGIGEHGLALIEAIAATKKHGERVNVLTHCNAGWLADGRLGHRDRADLSGARRAAMPSMSGSTRPGRATRAPR